MVRLLFGNFLDLGLVEELIKVEILVGFSKLQKKGGYGYFRWIGEPMSKRSKEVIPVLHHPIQELEEVNSMLLKGIRRVQEWR